MSQVPEFQSRSLYGYSKNLMVPCNKVNPFPHHYHLHYHFPGEVVLAISPVSIPGPHGKQPIKWRKRIITLTQEDLCMEYEVEGSRPTGRPKRTWREVVQKDCQARKLNREDAMDHSRCKKLIKVG